MINFKKVFVGIGLCFLALSFSLGHLSANENSIGTISASDVNLRSDSNTSSKILGRLQKGNMLKILAQNGDWLKISTSKGTIGWVKKTFVSSTQNITSRNDDRSLASRGETTRTFSENENVVTYAKSLLNVKYVWGGNTSSGFDCSGYTSYVYRKHGIELNRVAADQAKQDSKVDKVDLKPADLVFFDTDGGHNNINHVGIYIGNGMFIHSSSGNRKVSISNLNEGYYSRTYMTAKRVIN